MEPRDGAPRAGCAAPSLAHDSGRRVAAGPSRGLISRPRWIDITPPELSCPVLKPLSLLTDRDESKETGLRQERADVCAFCVAMGFLHVAVRLSHFTLLAGPCQGALVAFYIKCDKGRPSPEGIEGRRVSLSGKLGTLVPAQEAWGRIRSALLYVS